MPLFFFSYARADKPYLEPFFENLTEEVRSLAGHASAGPLLKFRDYESIEPGKSWPAEITEALRTCKVFVFLRSQTFFGRDGCGKEFRAIMDRLALVKGRSVHQCSCILPVHWNVVDFETLAVPEDIRELQYSHKDFGDDYNNRGMLILSRNRSDGAPYWDALTALAKRINSAAKEAQLPELPHQLDWDAIEPLFPAKTHSPKPGPPTPSPPSPSPGPRYARFIWIVAKPEEVQRLRPDTQNYDAAYPDYWQIFSPPVEQQAWQLAEKAASGVRLLYSSSEHTPETQQELLDTIRQAGKERTPVIVVIDVWTLKIARYRDVIAALDEDALPPNFGVIVPWNLQDQPTLTSRDELFKLVKDTLPLRYGIRDPYFVFEGITDPEKFEIETIRRLTTYKDAIRKILSMQRVMPPTDAPPQPPSLPTP